MKDWDDLRYFLAVARAGNVTAAAANLGVNHSTVSRRIRFFEERLGVRLFDKLVTGYALTPPAEKMLDDAKKIENDINQLSRGLASQDMRLSGPLRITAPEGIVSIVIMPHIAAFSKMHPGIEIEITATADIKNLNNREVDLAIRATSHPPEGLVGRKLAGQGLGKYVSLSYLKERGLKPNNVSAFSKLTTPEHTWVGYIGEKSIPQWINDHYPNARCAARFDSIYTIYQAVKAGIGIAELPCRLGETDPGLIRVTPQRTVPHQDIWILYHRDMRHTARLRIFSEYLTKIIVAERSSFEGTR